MFTSLLNYNYRLCDCVDLFPLSLPSAQSLHSQWPLLTDSCMPPWPRSSEDSMAETQHLRKRTDTLRLAESLGGRGFVRVVRMV